MKYINEKVETTISKLSQCINVSSDSPQGFKYKKCGYKTNNIIPEVTAEWNAFTGFVQIDEKDVHFWSIGKIKTPHVAENEYVALSFQESNQNAALQALYYLDGKIVTEFDANHTYTKIEPDREYDVAIYSYYQNISPYSNVSLSIDVRSSVIEKLYYDLLVPYDAATCLDQNSDSYVAIMGCLEQACNLIDLRNCYSDEFYQSIITADRFMMSDFYHKICGS